MTPDSLFNTKTKITFLKYLFWTGVITLTVISVIPKDLNQVMGIDIWDKLEHFISYFILSLTGMLAYREKRTLPVIFFGLVALGSGLEIIQVYIPNRQGGLDDAVANMAGVITGIAVKQLTNYFRADKQG